MWSNFFAAGGWGMYPVSIFGFLLVAASVLYAIRPQSQTLRLVAIMGLVTFAAGLLGTFTGVCTTFHFIQEVEHAKQFEIAALGCEESLHNLVLALIICVLGGLVTAAGTIRKTADAA